MKTVERMLAGRTKTVWSIAPDSAVSAALKLMAEKDVGALVVMEADRLVGIITERDVVRKLTMNGHNAENTTVRAIMTDRILYVRPEQTIEECMALMTEKHLRHLPVIDKGTLVGMVSIRDVVADLVAEQSFIIEQLENYVYTLPAHRQI
jgi:CBS domain-containing protein